MIDFFKKMNDELKTLGYRKSGNSFWKVEDGFYKLINFQKGAYGGGNYFVNIGLHPIGFPELLNSKISVVDLPKESECIFRLRVEQISETEQILAFRSRFVSFDDEQMFAALVYAFHNEVEQWFKKWGSYENIGRASHDDISKMINVIPILKAKSYYLLKTFCLLKMGDKDKAMEVFERYRGEQVEKLDFTKIDDYFIALL